MTKNTLIIAGFVFTAFFSAIGNSSQTSAHASEPKAGDSTPSDIAFFESKIRPILVKHCYECHSAAAAKAGDLGGGLQLDNREGIRRGGETGQAIVLGKPTMSLLLAAMKHERDLQMPPASEPLPISVIADFSKWISIGAPDPREGKPVAIAVDLVKAREFWALQPVLIPTPPNLVDQSWPRGSLDHFVASRRAALKLKPSCDATRSVLLRRLFFDLVGLPPTPDELKRLQSASTEQVIDYLLDSPHFGERWGRHWLDVARYAESNGRARNMAWQHAWRYRDWVIDSFNSDMPYDQFIAQQIAGDLMPADSSEQRNQQIIATGFLALGPKSLEERDRELFVMDTIDEQIDVIFRGILGLSVSCARCHDHKFDPIPTADYYSVAGILGSTATLYGIGPMGIKGVNDSGLAAIGPKVNQLIGPADEHLKTVQEQTQKRNTARSDRYRIVRRVADLKRQLASTKPVTAEDVSIEKDKTDKDDADNNQTKEEPTDKITAIETEIAGMEEEILNWDQRIKKMDEVLAKLVANPPQQPMFAMGAREAANLVDCNIRIRGEANNLGESVPRGVLQAIKISTLPTIGDKASGRMQLAKWLSSPENPLTARVMVNRIWQHLFGRGLVDTADDFGVTGSKPTHPELLDYLAARFMAEGWSTKKLIREIVLSRTYQLASKGHENGIKVDPDNVYLWKMSLRRLEVEPFRDALLTVSGQLNRTRREGSPIQQIGFFSDYEFNFKIKLTDEMIHSNHRSVYLPVVRGSLPEILKLFDFADPNSLVGRRDQTTVPSQSLFLLNSPLMVEFASKTTDRLLAMKEMNDSQRVQWLYQIALTREPSKEELRVSLEFLSSKQGLLSAANIKEDSESDDENLETAQHRQAWLSVCHAILASNEFRHIR